MHKLNRIFISGMLCMVSCMVFFGCKTNDETFIRSSEFEESSEAEESETDHVMEYVKDTEADGPLYVYVCGAVKYPGVYDMSSGARMFDAIERAGGFLENASENYLNLAELVNDGQMIYVPTTEEAADRLQFLDDSTADDKNSDGKININTASKELLTTISGIGNSRAENIIKYRDDNGNFAAIDDIKNVSGIGDSIFESIKDFITVN